MRKYFLVYVLFLSASLACKKGKETNKSTITAETPVTPSNPTSVPDRPDNWVMNPYEKQLVRYQQKPDACIMTSIFMLIHSMKGESAIINENATQIRFDGTNTGHLHDDIKLADDNQLGMAYWDAGSLLYNHNFKLPNPNDSYNDFKHCVEKFASILKVSPFVLDRNGHAVLIIGIDKTHGTVLYIDPMSPNNNSSCSILSLYDNRMKYNVTTFGATFYYSDNYHQTPYTKYNSTREDEMFFEKWCKK